LRQGIVIDGLRREIADESRLFLADGGAGSFIPTGEFQMSFAMQVGYSGGYDWIAGYWFA